MALQGDLRSIPFTNVLQDVAMNGLTGTVTIHAGENRRSLWFEKGKLRLVGRGDGTGPSLLHGLVALGKVEAVGRPARKGASLRSLLKSGSVTPEDLQAALELQITEEVCDLLRWSEGRFGFQEGEADEKEFDTSTLDLGIRLPVQPILLEAARRMDEWGEIRKHVLSPDEILVPLSPPPTDDPVVARIGETLDGERTLREIVEETRLGEFHVLRAAAECVRAGAARPLAVEEAIERARSSIAKGDHGGALRLARFGLQREPHHLGLRGLAAQALEALGRRDEAVSELRLLSSAAIERGEKKEALRTHRRILELAPRDTYARERVLALLLESGAKGEALEQGGALAAAYRIAGLPEKAKEVYTRLLRACGEDDDLLESAGEVARRLGDRGEAVRFYRRLFERAIARGDDEKALRHGRSVLDLDPSAADVARRRASLQTGLHRQRRRLRRRLKIVSALTLLLALVGVPATYELRARLSLAGVRGDAIALLQERDYETLLRRYNDCFDAFPWSLAVAETRRERDDLERSYLERALPKPPVEDERLLEALSTAEKAGALVRGKAAREEVDRVMASLEGQAKEIRKSFVWDLNALAEEGSAPSLERIAATTHPFAFEGIERLASHDSASVRGSAVRALAAQNSDRAFEALVRRLALDPDAGVRGLAREGLERSAGRSLGDDSRKWLEWLRRRQAEAGRIPPLLAVLERTERSAESDGAVVVEWRLENIGSAQLRVDLRGEWSARGPSGGRLAPVAGPSEKVRRVDLPPGGFVGGKCDLRERFAGIEEPGLHVVAWTAKVRCGKGAEVSIAAVPLPLEIAAAK